MSKREISNYILKILLIIFISFALGFFLGWKVTAEIDLISLRNLNDKIEDLTVELKETRHDLEMSEYRITYLENVISDKSIEEE